MSCKCQSCGKDYKVDLLVSDEIWEQIKPKDALQGGLLCGRCIMDRLEALGDYDSYMVSKHKSVFNVQGAWLEGVSDGLTLPCSICGKHTRYDYKIKDYMWEKVVPSNIKRNVICLSCLDELFQRNKDYVGKYIECLQYTSCNHTTVFSPTSVVIYNGD